MSTKTTSHKPDIWDELQAADTFSASTMQTILNFINQLWWAPEATSSSGFNTKQASDLGEDIISTLWNIFFAIPEGHPEAPDPIPAITQKLKSEISDALKSGQPQCTLSFITAMGTICENVGALNAFKRHVDRQKRTDRASATTAQSAQPLLAPQNADNLSANQQQAFKRCVQVGELFFSQRQFVKGFKIRSFPLIAGPTGAGKSHLVRKIAQALDCEYVRLDYGTWIPRGAKEDPNTMEFIADKALDHKRVLVHLDELDKLRGNFGSGWETSVLNDVWKLLDRPIDLAHLACAQSYEQGEEAFAKLFAERVWVVGSGTWQEIFERQSKSIGFNHDEAQQPKYEATIQRIRDQQLIPPELLGRFDSKIQILNYPMANEVVESLKNAGLELDDAGQRQLGEDLKSSGFRAVEDSVTEYSLQCMQNLPKQAEDSIAPPKAYDKPNGIHSLEPPLSACEPHNNLPHLATVQHLSGEKVQFHWQQRVIGKGLSGPTRAYEPIPHMEIWDTFAKKWDCPHLQILPRDKLAAWTLATTSPRPAIGSIYETEEDLYDFWQTQYEKQKDTSHEAELKCVVDQIHAGISPDIRRIELTEFRFKLSAALLYGDIYKTITQPDYTGPNLTELRWQCERYVDEGLYFLYQQALPDIWSAKVQDCFEDWELRLIRHVIARIEQANLICQKLQVPKGIKDFFSRQAPYSSWSDLSEQRLRQFRSALLETHQTSEN